MSIWSSVVEWIMNLFGVKSITTDHQTQRNKEYALGYENIQSVNFTAIFANKLSSLALTESACHVIAPADQAGNQRVEFLNEIIERAWKKSRKFTALFLGSGGCVLVPYVSVDKVYFDIVSQDQLFINKVQGDQPVAATFLANSLIRDNKRYFRWVDYSLENG